MIILQAPHTLIQTTSVFPNAELGDTLAPQSQINVLRSASGKTFTYVKKNNRRKLTYNISLTREKAIELREFYKAYNDQPIRLTNWNNEVWVVYFIEDSINIEILGRSEFCTIHVQFEGTKIN